jgi:hypothetical protein
MRPITFSYTDGLAPSPGDIAGRLPDLAGWTDFKGYGPLPGIGAAAFEVRTPGVIGSRYRVSNSAGSSLVEEIIEWEPDQSVRLRANEFSPPLSRLATEFGESWSFERVGNATRVVVQRRVRGGPFVSSPSTPFGPAMMRFVYPVPRVER